MSIESFVEERTAIFRTLDLTDVIPERLEIQGLATRGEKGALVLRDDVHKPLDDLESRLQASLDAGMTQRDAAEAAKLDVDHSKVTHVVYALFRKDGDVGLYIGETGRTPAERFDEHPEGCPELTAAMEDTGGKEAWTCAVLLVLPEDARSKELLLYIEARIQRLLDTVDGAHGFNCHYGAGGYGGAKKESVWISHYAELVEFLSKHGRFPSAVANDADEQSLGLWVRVQRQNRDNLSAHRRKVLEDLRAWRWRIISIAVKNDVLFDLLRADGRVIANEGMYIPADIEGVGAERVHSARMQFANGDMPESDRAIVLEEFPGLSVSGHCVTFWLTARAFADEYPGAAKLPSIKGDNSMYQWMRSLRTTKDLTSWHKNVLERFGISSILNKSRSKAYKAANRALLRSRADVRERDAKVTAMSAVAREEKMRRTRDNVFA